MNEMSSIPENSVDLFIVDLPYGTTANPLDIRLPMDNYIYETSSKGLPIYYDEPGFVKKMKKARMQQDAAISLFRDVSVPGLWFYMKRCLKPNGNVVLFAQGKFMMFLGNSDIDFFKYDVIWNKVLVTGHLNSKNMPMRQHESILVFNNSIQDATFNPQMKQGKPLHSKGKSYAEKPIVNQNYGKFGPGDDSRAGSTEKFPTTIWTYEKSHPSVAEHKTEKPLDLLVECVETWSNEGDVVVDFCAGRGTTGLACIKTNRKFFLIEKDQKEFDKIRNSIGPEYERTGIGEVFY